MFQVHAFTETAFHKAVATAKFPLELVEGDEHVAYLFRYLSSSDLAAKTIVVEPRYIDGDYLEDFAAYYATCFGNYERFCKRLHFFANTFSEDELRRFLFLDAIDASVTNLAENYLGFIIVRPLPDAIIGRTQLKTYGADGGRRNYKAVREYSVNLFGLKLRIHSLAFQEQDRVVAACATVALWSCFQKTTQLFETPAPRPPRITSDATASLFQRRSLPSDGLNVYQISSAIRLNGLEPEVFPEGVFQSIPLLSLIYGYLEYGLPILMIAEVRGFPQLHAFTINGYSLPQQRVGEEVLLPIDPSTNERRKVIALPGMRIDELYAHDDQIGPFSRLKVVLPSEEGRPFTMLGDWKLAGAPAEIIPKSIVVPVYRKVRVSYVEAYLWLLRICSLVEPLLRNAGYKRDQWEWSLRLTDTNAYKQTIRTDGDFLNERRIFLLKEPQPRFFWRSSLSLNGVRLAEFLIDATDFGRSYPLFSVDYFHDGFRSSVLSSVSGAPASQAYPPAFLNMILNGHLATA